MIISLALSQDISFESFVNFSWKWRLLQKIYSTPCVHHSTSTSLTSLRSYIMVIQIVEFSSWGYKFGKFLPKNQHTQMKLLNFENWCNGEVSKSAKIWLSKSIFYVKNHRIGCSFQFFWPSQNLLTLTFCIYSTLTEAFNCIRATFQISSFNVNFHNRKYIILKLISV